MGVRTTTFNQTSPAGPFDNWPTWIACCRHGRLPWETAGTYSYDDDVWELYNIAEDFSESVDLAEQEPAKLRELQDMFLAESAKYNVLPIDDRFADRLDTTLRPSFFTGRKKVTFHPGMVRLPGGSAPKMVGVPHTITVPVTIADGGAEGVLAALGGEAAGLRCSSRGPGSLPLHLLRPGVQ